jgi:hypothetical protein
MKFETKLHNKKPWAPIIALNSGDQIKVP